MTTNITVVSDEKKHGDLIAESIARTLRDEGFKQLYLDTNDGMQKVDLGGQSLLSVIRKTHDPEFLNNEQVRITAMAMEEMNMQSMVIVERNKFTGETKNHTMQSLSDAVLANSKGIKVSTDGGMSYFHPTGAIRIIYPDAHNSGVDEESDLHLIVSDEGIVADLVGNESGEVLDTATLDMEELVDTIFPESGHEPNNGLVNDFFDIASSVSHEVAGQKWERIMTKMEDRGSVIKADELVIDNNEDEAETQAVLKRAREIGERTGKRMDISKAVNELKREGVIRQDSLAGLEATVVMAQELACDMAGLKVVVEKEKK